LEAIVRATARCLIVALAICSWIATSNHCAFRALATKTETAQRGCPFHSKPAKHQPQPTGAECYKILHAVSNAPAKSPALSVADLPHVDLAFAEFAVFAAQKASFFPAALDTGPPGTASFVQLIGSLRVHAPPFLA